MSKLVQMRIWFLAAALLALFVAHFCFEVRARMYVGGDTFDHALGQTLHYAWVQPVGTILLFAPFGILAWLSASLGIKRSVRYAVATFLLGTLVFGAMYYMGHNSSEEAMLNKRWTAAALSVGLLPFKCGALLIIFWLFTGRQPAPDTNG